MFKIIVLTVLAAFVPISLAWGTLGHETVALIAQKYLTSSTESWAQGLLSDTSSTYLANIATWADTYRYTSPGSFSAPFHFLDAEDSPPSSCNVNYNRDCGAGGCVVSAINNYTSRVTNTKISTTERQTALKFIVHFLGDIHQPLHNEAIDVGGNTINVTFDGTSTNLHHIWDTNMPEKYIGGYSMTDAQTWANTITAAIDSGSYSSQKNTWLSGMNLSNPITSAMGWSADANAYVCSKVMPNGVSPLKTTDLDGLYYTGNTATIQLLIAKAGYRLAAWLNLIHGGTTGGLKVKRIAVVWPNPMDYNEFMADENSAARLARRAWMETHPDEC